MKMSDFPLDGTTVWVTYDKKVTFGAYNSESRIERVTKMGFYSPLFDNISIPPSWEYFTIGGERCLLPSGFGGDKLTLEQVISWEPLS